MNEALVSVVMSVYNAENYLEEAILSILNQTYKNFEFIIINDGSTDISLEIIEKYAKKDNRIKVISRENKGLIYSLNEGIKLSKGKYIARMDADDISLPDRFEKQVKFMENNLDVGVCGSSVISFNDSFQKKWVLYTKNEMLKAESFFSSPFAHPSVMIRKSIIDKYKLFYDKNFIHTEDFELWVKMAKYTNFYNFKEALLKYRISNNSITKIAENNIEERYKIVSKIFNNYEKLGFRIDYHLHFILSVNIRLKKSDIKLSELKIYFDKMLKENEKIGIFNNFALKKVLGKRWLWYIYYKKNFKAIFSKYFFYGILGLYK